MRLSSRKREFTHSLALRRIKTILTFLYHTKLGFSCIFANFRPPFFEHAEIAVRFKGG